MDIPKFTSPQEEIKYWKSQATEYKDRYLEAKEELDEFQLSSQELEAELEASLEQSEHKIKDLTASKCRLEMEVDSLREKLETLQATSHKQTTELEDNLAKITGHRDELIRYIRELEQSNDDLERAKRSTVTSLEDFESRLNQAIERNAFLESELDDKETLAITVQRLKDEARDLRSEIAVRSKPIEDGSPLKMMDIGNEFKKKETKVPVPVPVPIVDSNKLAEEIGTIPQTPVRPSLLNHTSNGTPLTPAARISALNIVGDLLRKVGSLENKLASCRNFVNNQPSRSSKANSNSSPLNSPRRYQRTPSSGQQPNYSRAKRLHRGSGSLQTDATSAATPRSSAASQQGYVNVKITI